MKMIMLAVLAAVLTLGCSPPEPSTGRAEIEVETPADAAVEADEAEGEIGETTDEAEAIEEAVELILEDVDAEESEE